MASSLGLYHINFFLISWKSTLVNPGKDTQSEESEITQKLEATTQESVATTIESAETTYTSTDVNYDTTEFDYEGRRGDNWHNTVLQ